VDNLVQTLWSLSKRTITEPRIAAQEVMAMQLPMQTRWMALVLASVLSALLLHFSLSLLPEADQQMLFGVPGPLESAMMQAGLLVLMAVLTHQVGRWRGGTGNFADALILIVWWQTVLLGFQVLQIMALLVLPIATDVLGLVGLVLVFWLLTSFVAELHAFKSLWKVLIGIILTLIGISVVLSMLMLPFMPIGTGS
jgi:Yip1 domain